MIIDSYALFQILHAKEMFNQVTKRQFQLDHCWNQLKNHPRWNIATSSEHPNKSSKRHVGASPRSSSPVTPDFIINLADDNMSTDHELERRPIGRKAAKEIEKKKKGKERDTTASLFQKSLSDYAEAEQLKKERFEKLFMLQEEYLKLENRKANLQTLALDTNGMDEARAEYVKKLQKDIMDSGS